MATKKLKITLLLITVLFFCISLGQVALAEDQGTELLDTTKIDKQDKAFIENAGLERRKLGVVVAQIIGALLAILGVVFIVLIIYAGILWMTSSGNEEQITKAKKIMTNALIGFIICASAYAITYFIQVSIISTQTKDTLEEETETDQGRFELDWGEPGGDH